MPLMEGFHKSVQQEECCVIESALVERDSSTGKINTLAYMLSTGQRHPERWGITFGVANAPRFVDLLLMRMRPTPHERPVYQQALLTIVEKTRFFRVDTGRPPL
jgi:hypothetical protein